MRLPSNVKPYPPFIKYFVSLDKGFNFGKTIYLNKAIYEDLLKDKPNNLSIAVLKHEEIHVESVKEKGVLKFGIKYIFSPKFRLHEELIAYEEMFKFLKQKDETYNLDRVAKALSSHRYLWVLSYPQAKDILQKLWKEV